MYTIHEGCNSISGNSRIYDVPNRHSWDNNNGSTDNLRCDDSSPRFKHNFSSGYSEQKFKYHGGEEADFTRNQGDRLARNGSLVRSTISGYDKNVGAMEGSYEHLKNLEISENPRGVQKFETNKHPISEEIVEKRGHEYETLALDKNTKLSSKSGTQSSLNQATYKKKVNLGGFTEVDWYKKIPNWERIIDERYTSVYSSYDRLEMIGTGTYAKVWLLKDKITGKKYAGKLLEPHTYPSDTVERIERMFQSEIKNLIISQCPGVVRLHKIVVGPEGSLLVQDYVDDGTIWRENCCVSELEAFQHFIQLIQSVLYFQDKGVVHRDLKPTNILRYSNKTIVIGDFGWSEQTKKLHLSPSEWPGTLEINPPEVLTFKGPLTEKIDNYAVGMNLLLFLTGRFICRQKGLDVTEAAPYILKVVELIRSDFNNKILSKGKQKGNAQLKQSQYFMWEIFIGFTDPNPNTRWSIQKALFHPDCIQQLLLCFHNNFPILWHPQVIAIIKSNIIPNIVTSCQSYIEDEKQYCEGNKQRVSVGKNTMINLSNADQIHIHNISHNTNFNNYNCGQNPVSGSIESQRSHFKSTGTSLRPTEGFSGQTLFNNDGHQHKLTLNNQFLPGSSDYNTIYNSEFATSSRKKTSVNSSSTNLNYTNNNHKFVGVEGSVIKQPHFINNFHY
ncbi:protein kinase [Cryptosporidium ubiquitum]|uniref:non-specific serine/threonine protein kinase n=1 Tax=Cryptosporidium ubiquitum TaxID=857276 RepID=A0A1J4MHE0_9CRYT|nr:protein kinase [Cryptosporidium ubiquitum]OII73423.1 protein kinase [Cryptosporidium ubiquitum]